MDRLTRPGSSEQAGRISGTPSRAPRESLREDRGARRVVVDAVGDEIRGVRLSGPVEDPHPWMGRARPKERRIPGLHVGLGIWSARHQALDGYPQHGLVSDHRHHSLDALRCAHVGSDSDVRSVVHTHRHNPASPVAGSCELACHRVGVGETSPRLDYGAGARDLEVLVDRPDLAVAGVQAQCRVGQVAGGDQALRGRVADVDHRGA